MDIKGFQDRAFDGTSFTVRNAGNLRHQGFEFDVVGKPLRNLSLFANARLPQFRVHRLCECAGPPGCAPRHCRRSQFRRMQLLPSKDSGRT